MRTIFCGIAFLCCVSSVNAQSVGVGTVTPHSSSVLDVNSSSKGFLLARIADTSNISGPAAGLVIYNQNTNSPNFFDGSKWQNLFTSLLSATGDSIEYSINGWGSPGTIINYYQGTQRQTIASTPQVGDFSFIKYNDVNSTEFKKRIYSGTVTPHIEFKCYLPGTATPYFSIKLYNFRLTYYRVAGSVSDRLIEEFSLGFTKIGFKDWINNTSFAYDISSNVVGGY